MDAKRRDAPLVHQANDLRFDFGRFMEDGVGLAPGHERAVIAVAAVGKAFGEIGCALRASLVFQHGSLAARAAASRSSVRPWRPARRHPAAAAPGCTTRRAA